MMVLEDDPASFLGPGDFSGVTLPKTNIASEGGPKPKRKGFRLPSIIFQVQTVSFGEGKSRMK